MFWFLWCNHGDWFKLFQPPQTGFHIVFDNVNIDIRSRHKSLQRQNRHLDMVHGLAVNDRVNCQDLDNSGPAVDIMSVPDSIWLLSPEEHNRIKASVSVLVKRAMKQHMAYFKDTYVLEHIPHENSKEMAEKSTIVCIGILVIVT